MVHFVLIIDETQENVCLANCAISYNNQFDHIVIFLFFSFLGHHQTYNRKYIECKHQLKQLSNMNIHTKPSQIVAIVLYINSKFVNYEPTYLLTSNDSVIYKS